MTRFSLRSSTTRLSEITSGTVRSTLIRRQIFVHRSLNENKWSRAPSKRLAFQLSFIKPNVLSFFQQASRSFEKYSKSRKKLGIFLITSRNRSSLECASTAEVFLRDSRSTSTWVNRKRVFFKNEGLALISSWKSKPPRWRRSAALSRLIREVIRSHRWWIAASRSAVITAVIFYYVYFGGSRS